MLICSDTGAGRGGRWQMAGAVAGASLDHMQQLCAPQALTNSSRASSGGRGRNNICNQSPTYNTNSNTDSNSNGNGNGSSGNNLMMTMMRNR